MLQLRDHHPSTDLAPYIRNHFVLRVPFPDNFVLSDRMMSETAMIRILLGGRWSARFDGGEWHSIGPAILFGPNSRCFEVRVEGGFTVVGCAIRPSGWSGLFDRPADTYVDQMVSLSDAWGKAADDLFPKIVAVEHDDDAIIQAIERVLRDRIRALPHSSPNQAMAAFEALSLTDSAMLVGNAAKTLCMSMPTMKRHSYATFGLAPKSVLRRSRFLDMATMKRGIGLIAEAEQLMLRFSDQSHLNREFRHFIGMTPGEFDRTPTPLLDSTLVLRHQRMR
jgi:AraC-like DNA-binding protein